MPNIPSALPRKAEIRAAIRVRGYRIDWVAGQIGCRPSTLYAMTGRSAPRATGLDLLRDLAAFLSTPKRPVRVSDISDWTGDDDIESEPEPKALAS